MDHVLVLAFAVAWPLHGLLSHRRYREGVRRGEAGARLAAYAQGMLTQWLFVALAVALWIRHGRDFGLLGLRAPSTAAAWAALAVAAAVGRAFLLQSAVVARRPDTHPEVREALAPVVEILPRDRNDLTGFLSLSLTAGICEEILFRGLLPWYLGHALGLWGGQALALALFALAHLYLGGTATWRAGLAGAAAGALYLWSGSLVPSMLLHASLDASAGWMAYVALRSPEPAEPA
jgi:hypothetical protein